MPCGLVKFRSFGVFSPMGSFQEPIEIDPTVAGFFQAEGLIL
jgi:hypothetical protein